MVWVLISLQLEDKRNMWQQIGEEGIFVLHVWFLLRGHLAFSQGRGLWKQIKM